MGTDGVDVQLLANELRWRVRDRPSTAVLGTPYNIRTIYKYYAAALPQAV
jgi:hypothetical protein